MNGDKEIARRIRAARELAGIRSAEALADAIGEEGLAKSTIRAMEQAKRIVQPSELAIIARVCDLPVAFFHMNFWEAARLFEEPSEATSLSELQAVVRGLDERLTVVEVRQGRVAVEALAQVEQALRAAGFPAPPRPPR